MILPEHLETADPRQVGFHDAIIGGWFDNRTGDLAPGFPIHADDIVVDVGCGDGSVASFAAMRGARMILCDVDAAKVRAAATTAAAKGARAVEPHVADGAALPLPDGIGTRVICTEVLEHVDDARATMAEVARVAAPGALVLLTVPGDRQERIQQVVAPRSYFEKPNHVRIIPADELRRLTTDAGLTIEREDADGFFWSLYYAFFWDFGSLADPRHPTLDRWAKVWTRVVQAPGGLDIKRALDKVLPRRSILVARKPGAA